MLVLLITDGLVGAGFWWFTRTGIAIDGLAAVVNPSLNIPGLTIDQLKSIYSGKTTNWKGTVELFGQEILGGGAFGSNVEFVSTTTQALRELACSLEEFTMLLRQKLYHVQSNPCH